MINMLKICFKERKLLFELAKNDVKSRFSSSVLGAAWTVMQPLINMLVIWLVFQAGFKSSNLEGDIPFIVWYMPAFLSWNLFSESVSQATNSIQEYSYLVKKVNFSVEIIPAIKIVSNTLIHLFFIAFIIFVNLCYGRLPNLYYLQVIYYAVCCMAISLAIGLLTSAVTPFTSDVANIVSIIIQTGFWGTPIFWDPSQLTKGAQMLIRLNPIYYICNGYRDCFVYQIPFYAHRVNTLYFWGITIVLWLIGSRTFNKAKQHFDDVL